MNTKLRLLTLILFGSLSLNAQVLQRVVVEEHTGAWCGYCPEGAMIIHDILAAEPNAIGVAIHQGDGMQIAASGYIRSFYGPAFPQATINREGAPISRGSWAAAVDAALLADPLVAVSFDSVALNMDTRILTCRLKATFLRDTAGTLRFNLYVTEDGVTGTGANYDQVNYFNSTSGHPFQGLGNPIVGYVHDHVLRDAKGGAWGTVNSIPSTITANQEVLYTYTMSIPSYWDVSKANLVASVGAFGGGAVYQRPTLNADEMPLQMAVGIDNGVTPAANLMHIWPNPSSNMVNISFTVEDMGLVTLEVFNASGQRVSRIAEGVTNSGAHTVTWDGRNAQGQRVAEGIYFVRMFTEQGESRSQKVYMQGN